MNSLTKRLETIPTQLLKDCLLKITETKELFLSQDTDLVFSFGLIELEKRIPEQEFIAFCEKLEVLM